MAKAKVILELSIPETEFILQALSEGVPKERRIDANLLYAQIRKKTEEKIYG